MIYKRIRARNAGRRNQINSIVNTTHPHHKTRWRDYPPLWLLAIVLLAGLALPWIIHGIRSIFN